MFDLLETQQNPICDVAQVLTEQPEDEQSDPVERRPRQLFVYKLEQTFPDKESCEQFIQLEHCWVHVRDMYTTRGIKVLYRCLLNPSRGAQCLANIFALHSTTPDDNHYHLYRRVAEHNHVNPNDSGKLSTVVKQLIEGFVDDQLTLVPILFKLQNIQNIGQPGHNQVKN